MSRSHAETAYCHVTMTQFHVTTTQCHVTKSRIAAPADSKPFAGGHCDVAITRFHMDMSRRYLSTHDCECTPTQNPVEATSNHMPATQSESAIEQTRRLRDDTTWFWFATIWFCFKSFSLGISSCFRRFRSSWRTHAHLAVVRVRLRRRVSRIRLSVRL